jgi:tetratricopeptide (TPR) repeat protein/ADP-ribose pyrophosphatase YjhB (NUDIX family)
LDNVCRIVEELYDEVVEEDIELLILKTEKKINEVIASGKAEERICKFPYKRVCEDEECINLIFACTLFVSGNIPLAQVLDTADVRNREEPIGRVLKWGVLQKKGQNGNREYFVMHDIFHSYVKRKFENQNDNRKKEFKRRFVQTWFKFLINTDNVQLLWGNYDNLLHAIRISYQPEFDDDESFDLKSLNKDRLKILRGILPPKERRRFLFRILEDETDLEKIAFILNALSDSFIRAGKLIIAEGFGLQSLRYFEKLNKEEFKVSALRQLGTIYRSTGDYDKSKAMLTDALNISETLGDKPNRANILRQRGQTNLEMGLLKAAHEDLSEAISLLEELDDCKHNKWPERKNSLAYALNTLGNIQLRLGIYEMAKNNLEKAKMKHENEVGATHFFVAYDLRYLAKAELCLGNMNKAINYLNESLKINQRFFGDSPNVALVYLTTAEAYLKLNNFEEAISNAEKALKMYIQEVGKHSKFVAFAYRVLAEIYLKSNQLEKAGEFCKKSFNILEQKYLETPHFTEVNFLNGKINLNKKEIKKALDIFWKTRSEFVKFRFPMYIKKVDEYIISALLQTDIADWDASVESYKKYLNEFPDSLHNQLGNKLVEILKKEIKTNKIENPKIVDIFCGTGFVSKQIAKMINSNVSVTGIDGSKEMIEESRKWEHPTTQNFNFYNIPSECGKLENSKFRYVTLQMGIFQLDLRARHVLFQKLLEYLDDDCTILLTTYAADFEFPNYFEKDFPDINHTNPFKEKLFAQFQERNYNPCSLGNSVCPVYTKENFHNLSCFFELYGFEIISSGKKKLDILQVERKWEDRIAFTRIPVISKKIFRTVVPDKVWASLRPMPDYYDKTYGALIKVKRKHVLTKIPVVFSHVNVDFTKGYPLNYAVAAILKNMAGKTLFLKRGEGAHDYINSWSLPSTFVDENVGMRGSLHESLERNIGIKKNEITSLSPVSIRFNLRKDKNGKNWIIVMCLFEGKLSGIPKPKTNKYQEIRFDDVSFIENEINPKEIGDCIKSYRDLFR